MKPLIVLLVVFVASLIFTKLFQNRADYHFAGKLALAVMLVFTATGHFVYTRGMMMMLPDFITYKESIIYLTGILEIVAAAGIFFPPLQNLCGSLLILFFVLLLPANILRPRTVSIIKKQLMARLISVTFGFGCRFSYC